MAKAVSKRKSAGKKAAGRTAPRKAAAKSTAKPAAAKPATAKAPPKKKAVPAASVQRKAAPPRRRAAKPAVRRTRPAAAPKRKAAAVRKQPTRAAPQRFTVSHLKEADFKTEGLRPYAQYRDLGIAIATAGLCQAHVIRLVPPCTDEVRKRHIHTVDLQLVYVLKGWVKNEFEGHGEQMMSQGSCWVQPPGIPHTVLDYSADCELLEIVVPADFKTAEL
ncbi:MAG: cupin domain-containing protein [Acetobacteraceae bacterium]|nr:cupin domain-containing protein [Acetobacteraceae bacterium]